MGNRVLARMELVDGSMGSLSGPREMVLCEGVERLDSGRLVSRRGFRWLIGPAEAIRASMA